MKRLIATISLILLASQVWAVGAPVRIDGGSTVAGQSDISVGTSVTLIASSNSNRAALNCTTTANVRWGPSSITVTKGQLIPANGSIAIQNTAAIYMIAESDTATVSCTEEAWPSVTSGSGVFSP